MASTARYLLYAEVPIRGKLKLSLWDKKAGKKSGRVGFILVGMGSAWIHLRKKAKRYAVLFWPKRTAYLFRRFAREQPATKFEKRFKKLR
jgi:hypothetical protein